MANLQIRSRGPEGKLLDWLDQIESEGTYWNGRALRDADRYVRLFFGRRRAADASSTRFRANVIGPTIRRRNSLLTENKPVFKIEPLTDGLQATAQILNELSEFAWQDHGFGSAIEEMVEPASIFGAAGMSLPFDFKANGGAGSVRPIVRDRRSVIIDPGVRSAGDIGPCAKYVRVESVESIWDLQRDFPGRGMEVKPEPGLSSTVTSPLSPIREGSAAGSTSYRDHIKRLQEGPIPRALKRVYFVRDPALTPEGQMRFPLGRMIVKSGDVILHDGPAPFFDGEPDLVWFENRRDIDSVNGESEVEALRYLQGAINRIGAMFVNNTVLMGNARVVADSDALGNDAVNRLTNSEALVIIKKFGRQVDWQPPPGMPPHFLGFITFALRLVDYLIGLSDGQLEGRGRIEMRSGVQLEGLQSAAQVLVRAMARRMEGFIERLGRKFISRIFQFYRHDRILLATGPGGQFTRYKLESDKLFAEIAEIAARAAEEKGQPFDMVLREHIQNAWAQFAFRVQPLSSLAQTKVARAQMLMQLVEQVMMPRSMVLREVGYNNADELLNEARAEAAQMAQLMPQQPKKGGSKKKGAVL